MGRFSNRFRNYFNNQYDRDAFVEEQLQRLPAGSLILDAGAGSQRYRKFCHHLKYRAQDLAEYQRDDKRQLGDRTSRTREPYSFGPLDYVGNIWDIDEEDSTFDAILCTEVFEHIPRPIEALRELSRLLKPGGTLILTVPSNCLRHFDPFFFTTGFSDRWLETFCDEMDLQIELLEAVGDYYRWIAVELYRTIKIHPFALPLIAPSLTFYAMRRMSSESVDTLCMGYHLVAKKPGL